MLPRPLLSLLILFSFFFILHTTNSHFLSLDCFHISFNFLRIHFFSLFRSLLSPLPPHSSSCYNHILLAHFTWNPNHSHSNKKKTATTKFSIISMFIFRFFFLRLLCLYNVYIVYICIFILCFVCVRVYFLILLILSICLVYRWICFSIGCTSIHTRVEHTDLAVTWLFLYHYTTCMFHHLYAFCTQAVNRLNKIINRTINKMKFDRKW